MTQLLVQCDQLHSERVWIHNKLYYFQRIKMKIKPIFLNSTPWADNQHFSKNIVMYKSFYHRWTNV